MDANTEILLNISKQLGLLTAKMENVEKFMAEHKAEMAQLKEDIRAHEGIHLEVAPKKDVDELWVQIRKHDKAISALENAPANQALQRDRKIKEQLLSIAVGILGLAGVGALIYAIADNIVKGVKP